MRATTTISVLAASLALAACGSDQTILDTEKVERAIERSSVEQRDTHPRVSCPSGVHQEEGLTFSCTATVGRGEAEFVVTQLDGAGNVSFVGR